MKSLLELILEEIEYEKLIEEGKDPVELLHYKFQNVPSNIIDKVIEIDPTNNTKPTQLLERNTGYRKNESIFNYQVSHVFGLTKNVF